MSFDKIRRAMAVTHRCRDVKGVAVLLILADQYFEDTGECCPLVEELMDRTRLSRNSVIRACDDLEEDQLIAIDRRFGARHYFTLQLDGQLALQDGPRLVGPPREKRATGFRVKPRPRSPETHANVAWVSPVENSENPCQPGMGLEAQVSNNRSQPEIATHAKNVKTDLRLGSDSILATNTGSLQPTATAAPRLPFPIAIKNDRARAERAKVGEQHRLQKLRRRVAGYAIGLILKPDRGLALIQESITTEATLVAATKELCAKKGVEGYHEVLVNMCASVWWRYSLYGKAVIAGKAPRPRDRRGR